MRLLRNIGNPAPVTQTKTVPDFEFDRRIVELHRLRQKCGCKPIDDDWFRMMTRNNSKQTSKQASVVRERRVEARRNSKSKRLLLHDRLSQGHKHRNPCKNHLPLSCLTPNGRFLKFKKLVANKSHHQARFPHRSIAQLSKQRQCNTRERARERESERERERESEREREREKGDRCDLGCESGERDR